MGLFVQSRVADVEAGVTLESYRGVSLTNLAAGEPDDPRF
jgi:hypothetical protein